MSEPKVLKHRKDFRKGCLQYGFVLIAIGLGIIVIDAIISFVRGTFLHLDSAALIVGGVSILLGLPGFYFAFTSESGNTDVSKDIVKKAEGPINIIKAERTRMGGGTNTTSRLEHYFAYELHVGGKEFDVDESLANVTMQGDEYAVYYDDFNNKILSAEFVSKAK